MLNSCINLILEVYIASLFVHMIFYSIKLLLKNQTHICGKLSTSKFTYYLCSLLSLIVALALYLNFKDYDNSIIWFYVIFGLATILSMILVLWNIMWRVEYTNRLLVYRNIFGTIKKYDIEKIWLTSKNQYTSIMINNKKITDYNFMFMDIEEVRTFESRFNKK